MRNIDEGRYYLRKIQTLDYRFQCKVADWMTPDQAQQLRQFCEGKAVPTDPEIIEGLKYCSSRYTRSARWMFSNVSAFVVDEPSYSWWCQCIEEALEDPDLRVDEGL